MTTLADLTAAVHTAPITILCASVPQGIEYEDRADHRSVCATCGRVDYTRFMRIAVQHGQVIATVCPVCALTVKEAQTAPTTQTSTIADVYGEQMEAREAQAAATERPSLYATFQTVQAERMVRETDAAQFDAALLQATAKAKTAYPLEACRIERGLQIAIVGGVTLLPDGTALVQSQTHRTVRYQVNGHCPCVDAKHAPEARCKHRWSKSLVKWALKAGAVQSSAAPTQPLCPVCLITDCPGCTPSQTPTQSLPATHVLPESPVSMNLFVHLPGQAKDVQVTGRGFTALEAAQHLKAGVDALYAAFA